MTETIAKGLKQVVLNEHEFECRNYRHFLAPPSTTIPTEQKNDNSFVTVLHKERTNDWDLDEEVKPKVIAKYEIENPDVYKSIAFLQWTDSRD